MAFFPIGKKTSIIAGFDIGFEQESKLSSQMNSWYSPVLIGKLDATEKLSLSARAEYYSDQNGVIISTNTSNGFQTFGFSFNVDFKVQKNALWRLEARTLKSRDNIFDNRSSNQVSNSKWISTAVSVDF